MRRNCFSATWSGNDCPRISDKRSSTREWRFFLDSGRLGLITQRQRSHKVIAITDRLKGCLRAYGAIYEHVSKITRLLIGIVVMVKTNAQRPPAKTSDSRRCESNFLCQKLAIRRSAVSGS